MNFLKEEKKSQFQISDEWVLTAAHCVADADAMTGNFRFHGKKIVYSFSAIGICLLLLKNSIAWSSQCKRRIRGRQT